MNKKKSLIYIIIIVAFLFNWISAQEEEIGSYSLDIPNSSTRYLTDDDGNVRMWINIWGYVNKPGNYLVYNTTDVLTVLAMAGGLKSGAAIDRIKLYRELPDVYGNLVYTVDMKDFEETGERKFFPNLLPNDAIYVPQRFSSYVLSNVGLVNTIFSAVNLYYLAVIRRDQTK